jgi:hypothetical protein
MPARATMISKTPPMRMGVFGAALTMKFGSLRTGP